MADKHKRSKILIADESISIQKLVNLTFADTEFEVVVAQDGQDVLQKAKTLKPEVVLVDSAISRVDGFSILDALRNDSALSHIRIVLFFSGSDKDFAQKINFQKPDGILRKPFDSRDLKEVVMAVLGEEPTMKTGTIRTSTTQTIVLDEKVEKEAEANEPTLSTVVKTAPTPQVAPMPPSLSHDELLRLSTNEIKAWFAEHLPPIAERMIKEEIERIAR